MRIKNNCKYISNNENKINNEYIPKNIPENIRFINYKFNVESTKELYNKKKQEYELYKIIKNTSCNIATNLDNNFNDDNIRNIYNSRWEIEEYFKLLKSNFKFSLLREHNKNTHITYEKSYLIIKIFCTLERIFELICNDHINYSNNKFNIKINKTLLIDGLYKIIPDIIFSKLTSSRLLSFFNIYINFNYTEKDKNNPRISKIPFTKWYIKDYYAKYDIQKIFDAFLDDNTNINKNLKLKLKDIIFEKIT